MNKDEYNTELEKIVKKDCKKIMSEIMELYNERVEVNKSFYTLVKERIDEKYLYLLENYYSSIIKMIPDNLYVCPSGRWALVNEHEFDEIMVESVFMVNKPKQNISNTVDNIIDELITSDDFFKTVNKYLKPLYPKHISSKEEQYIIDEIYYGLKKRGYTIESISPLEIKPI